MKAGRRMVVAAVALAMGLTLTPASAAGTWYGQYYGANDLYQCGDYVGGTCFAWLSSPGTSLNVSLGSLSGSGIRGRYTFYRFDTVQQCGGGGYGGGYGCYDVWVRVDQTTGTFCDSGTAAVPGWGATTKVQYLEIEVSAISCTLGVVPTTGLVTVGIS